MFPVLFSLFVCNTERKRDRWIDTWTISQPLSRFFWVKWWSSSESEE